MVRPFTSLYGAAPKDVQELLGHSDVTTTMNIYAHASREAKRDAAKLLDKVQLDFPLFFPGKGKNKGN